MKWTLLNTLQYKTFYSLNVISRYVLLFGMCEKKSILTGKLLLRPYTPSKVHIISW